MTTLDCTILGGTICGIFMVFGGIVLLYKGSLKLEVASKDPALTLELFRKQFRLTTNVPALGIFMIGLLFIGLSIHFAKATEATPIEVKGETELQGEMEGVTKAVTVYMRSEWGIPAPQGKIHHILRPHLDVLWIYISAPGYKPYCNSFSKEDTSNGLDFGTITLTRKIEPIESKIENIKALPHGTKSPPLKEGGSFGRGGKL